MLYCVSPRNNLMLLILGILFLFCIPQQANAQPMQWMEPLSLESQVGWKAEPPDIAIEGRFIFMVWHTWITEYTSHIRFSMSDDAGRTWTEPMALTSEESVADSPKIACDKNIVHVVWKEVQQNYTEIYYTRSLNYGQTWDAIQQLTFNNTITTNIYDVKIAVQHSMVYVIWKDYRTGSSEVFLKKSTDSGETWSDNIRITTDYTPSYHPAITTSPSMTWIVWDDWGERADICYSYSTDDGNSWNGKHFLTQQGESKEADIAIEGNHVYIVWEDNRDGNYEVYFKESPDRGLSWYEDQRLTNASGFSVNPQLAVNNNTITVVWMDNREGTYDIYYKQRDIQNQWTTDYLIQKTGSDELFPCISLMKGYPCIAWKQHDNAAQSDVVFIQALFSTPLITALDSTLIDNSTTKEHALHVYGVDQFYTMSELHCQIQIKFPLAEWNTLDNVMFVDDHWEQTIAFSDVSQPGNYLVRAKVQNPEGTTSPWSEYLILSFQQISENKNSPGFEGIGVFVALTVIMFGMTLFYHTRRQKQ